MATPRNGAGRAGMRRRKAGGHCPGAGGVWGRRCWACEMGRSWIDGNTPERRWQGSDAAEEIGRILPGGEVFVAAYRAMPGMKWIGDRVYEQVRDNRYTLFGKRPTTYKSAYPVGCRSIDNCATQE